MAERMTIAMVQLVVETHPDAKAVTEQMVTDFVVGHLSIQDALMADGHPPLSSVSVLDVELTEEPDGP